MINKIGLRILHFFSKDGVGISIVFCFRDGVVISEENIVLMSSKLGYYFWMLIRNRKITQLRSLFCDFLNLPMICKYFSTSFVEWILSKYSFGIGELNLRRSIMNK